MSTEMTLGTLIEILTNEPPDKVCPLGFRRPHSYRGYYEDLAFEPAENVTVAEMLSEARLALGAIFTGYKGGEFKMEGWTAVWLANYGQTGETLGPRFLKLLLENGRVP